MSDYELIICGPQFDPNDCAVASFLARYRGMTLHAYREDLLAFLRWCIERQLTPLAAEKPHLELYLRWQ